MAASRRILPVLFILVGILAGWLALDHVLTNTLPNKLTMPASNNEPVPLSRHPRSSRLSFPDALTFSNGMQALERDNIAAAITARNGLPRGSLYRDTLSYAITARPSRTTPSAEYEASRRELALWPVGENLRNQYERALYRENPSAEAIHAAFQSMPPQTPEGIIILARAFNAQNAEDAARNLILPLWTSHALNRWLEDEIIKYFPTVLKQDDHRARMKYLLYRDRIKQASRFAKLASAEVLFDAWSATIRDKKNADKLREQAAKAFSDDPALTFIEILALRHKEKFAEAASLLELFDRDSKTTLHPDEWWNERRIISRGLYERGDVKRAYALVAAHGPLDGESLLDAEFHAGWYALRGLGDPQAAGPHFEKLIAQANTPISQSRGYYWLARAQEKQALPQATEIFEKAASFGGTFYGQLAAEHVRMAAVTKVPAYPTTADMHHTASSPPMRAVKLLERFGYKETAAGLMKEIARETHSPTLLAYLTDRATRNHDASLALAIGKDAYNRGDAPFPLAFPLSAVPDGALKDPEERALALAIARQESGFNAAARSASNALGLMQLVPATAREVAKDLNLAFAQDRLTSDTTFNIVLGVNYAKGQVSRFGGSHILTFAAYNAGPNKVREWLRRFGDPRRMSQDDIIDWVELIPYPETRNYVQRVVENLTSYRMLLDLKPMPLR